MHNAFTTNIARFCPTAPGSGLVKGPSWLESPEPGTYYNAVKWNDVPYLEKTIRKYNKKIHKDQVTVPTPKAPGIPSKKLAQTAYTGRGHDTVGPAAYNPKSALVEKHFGETDFTASKTTRKTFDPSEA